MRIHPTDVWSLFRATTTAAALAARVSLGTTTLTREYSLFISEGEYQRFCLFFSAMGATTTATLMVLPITTMAMEAVATPLPAVKPPPRASKRE